MKWGRKKPVSTSSPRPPSTSRVFPMFWLSRLKKMSGSSSPKPANPKRKGKKGSTSPCLPMDSSWNEGRFYGRDNDSYPKLSFGGDNCRNGGLKSVWYDSDDELDVPMSSSRSSKLKASMVSDRRKVRELPRHVEIQKRNDACGGKKDNGEADFRIARKAPKYQESRTNRRLLEEKQAELERESREVLERIIQTERDYQKSTPSNSRRQRNISNPDSNLRRIEEECALEALNSEETETSSEEAANSDWQNLKELKLKREKQMKSQKRRTKQSSKIRVYSPRASAKIECKIKAIEDMKKAKMKMKMKKVAKVRAGEKDTTAFDSFAVVKSSLDPQQDFRDSMVEMIIEKGIKRPEELEELLACYLTLNCDEYHDLIIKVFRQVWFDLDQVHFDPELQFEHCCND